MFNDISKLDVTIGNNTYIPTEEDRENDRRMEEWQERRREEARRTFLRHHNPYQHKFAAE